MKKNIFKRRHINEDMNLQITSMADIFIIILVFLLKSFATGAIDVNPSKGVTLPVANSGDQQIQALKVEVSQSLVSVEGQPVSNLTNYRFDKSDLQSNGSSTILGKAFEKERQRQLLIAKSNTDVKIDPKILIISDQKTPYSTVKSVLASAALQGYTDFKLAVVRGN